MAGRIIAVANQKGGVGKTTTSVNLGAALALSGRQTLLVDLDPQGNATTGLGVEREHLNASSYEVLIGGKRLEDALLSTELGGLDLLPASMDLVGAELELVSQPDRETRLREALMPIAGHYAYMLIDCPPSLGLLTINALVAAETVLIPVQCEYYAMQGLGQTLRTVELVQQHLNTQLVLEGVLLTMFDARNTLCHLVAKEVRTHLGTRVFGCHIPRNVSLAEAPSHGKPVLLYGPGSRGAQSYLHLAREVMQHEENAAR